MRKVTSLSSASFPTWVRVRKVNIWLLFISFGIEVTFEALLFFNSHALKGNVYLCSATDNHWLTSVAMRLPRHCSSCSWSLLAPSSCCRQGLRMWTGALRLTISTKKNERFFSRHSLKTMKKSWTYLEGEAGVDRLEAALARILDEELLLLPSWERELRMRELPKRIILLRDEWYYAWMNLSLILSENCYLVDN